MFRKLDIQQINEKTSVMTIDLQKEKLDDDPVNFAFKARFGLVERKNSWYLMNDFFWPLPIQAEKNKQSD